LCCFRFVFFVLGRRPRPPHTTAALEACQAVLFECHGW
jgi:hypothetical protein